MSQRQAPNNLYIPHNTDHIRESSGTDDLSIHSDVESDVEEEYLDSGIYAEEMPQGRLRELERRILELESERRPQVNAKGGDKDDKRTSLRDIDFEKGDQTPSDLEKGLSKTTSARESGQQGLGAGFGFHAPPQKDPNLVEWDGPDDPGNPRNWGMLYKCWATCILSFVTIVVTFNSSIYSTALPQLRERFDVSNEVVTLGTSFVLLGFAFGPIVFGPLSELYGRKIPMFFGFFAFVIFQIPEAVAGNLETVLLSRFFGGCFGSAPLAIVGGAFSDIWDIIPRSIAIVIYGSAVFLGPVFGPIVGSFVSATIGWRWTAWITGIFGLVVGLLALFTTRESYEPLLLQKKAAKLRYQTKNWALHAKLDEQPITMDLILRKYFTRVFVMMFQEPILLLLTLYMSLIYGIIYLFFSAYPIAFQQVRHWKSTIASLPFLALVIGAVLAGVYVGWESFGPYKKKLLAGTNTPEDRLPSMILAGVLMPIGLFWFAWTSSPNITWVPQVLAGIPMGFGVVAIFMQGFNYLIDCYTMNANSAIAANTIMRSFFGAGFPLFATQMFHKLGVNWASSLLGFLCMAMVPIPIVFYFKGPKIRAWSKFVPSH